MSTATPVEMVDVHRKDKPLLSREEAENMSKWMSQAIISRLSEDIEDLHATAAFRSGFQRCCSKFLSMASSREERVLFFHESIPGFTVMVVKKMGWTLDETAPVRPRRTSLRQASQSAKSNGAENHDHEDESAVENEWETAHNQVVEQVIESFVSRTGNRVLTLEAQDVIVILFPAADLKRNLQDMGFWFD